jgi:glycosyltransferase involved in cell wall biosynthesis
LRKNLPCLPAGRKVALYNPYLDVLGGGEKHILSILKALEDKYEINIFWDKNLEKEIEQKFSLHYINKLKWLPNIFRKKGNWFKKFIILRNFDLFFYVTDGSYFISSAKKNFVFCMVPNKDLYPMSFLNRLKTLNFKFITNSRFTHHWLKEWGIKNDYIYPYISDEFLSLDLKKLKKEKIILSVGRFFKHLHAKRQEVIINLFKKIKQNNLLFKDFKLILAGGLRKEDKEYLNQLEKLTGGDRSIILEPNLNFNELYKLYKLSTFYWHFTGFEVNENQHPESVEHLGIAPLEAMINGCLTFCYKAGGPKELIKDGKNGFLFSDEEELIKKIHSVVENSNLRWRIISDAQKYVAENFNYQVFKKRVKEVLT